MTEFTARKELPIWAGSTWTRQDQQRFREMLGPKREIQAERFKKRYGLALIAMFIWAASMILGCCITGSIVRRNTEQEVEARCAAEYAAQLQAYKNQQAAERIITGDASKAAAMKADAAEIAKVLYGVRNNSKEDLRTCVWCILNRVDNAGYPGSVEEVCRQSQQWMGYSEENPVLDDLFNLAYGELEVWYGGIRPVSSDYIYLHWSPTEITLRDAWKDGSGTHYWQCK